VTWEHPATSALPDMLAGQADPGALIELHADRSIARFPTEIRREGQAKGPAFALRGAEHFRADGSG
jgi:hypothetical protein